MTNHVRNNLFLYRKGTEFLTLEETIPKKKWKKFGSVSQYLDYTYGNENWQFIYASSNTMITRDELIDLISKSFSNYFQDHLEDLENWNELIFSPRNPNFSDNNQDDSEKNSILNDRLSILVDSFSQFLQRSKLLEENFSNDELYNFFSNNKKICYSIPFYDKTLIQVPERSSNEWSEDSIHAFFAYNTIIQVKTKILEEKRGIGIAIFVRSDLKMGKGKIAAQCSHAAVSLIFQSHFKSEFYDQWLSKKQKQVQIFKIPGLKELIDIEKKCNELKINNSMISDAGHTQISPGTKTCIGIGPLPTIWLTILAKSLNASKIPQ